jgi:hypothetical protein
MEKKSVTRRFLSFLENYFFSKASPYTLGLLRLVLVGCTLVQMFNRYYAMHRITLIDAEFIPIHQPSHLMRLLSVPFPLPTDFRFPFAVLYYLIGGCAMIGLFTRPAVFIFGLLNVYIFDIQLSRGLFDHEMGLISQIFMILAFVPGAASFSADRFFKWSLQKDKKITLPVLVDSLVGPPAPVWGLKLILILLACTYFTAGLSKIRYGGIKWADGKTLTHYLDGSASPYLHGVRPIFISPANVPENRKWKDGFGIYSYSWGNKQQDISGIKTGKRISSINFFIMILSVGTLFIELSGFILLTKGWPKFLYLVGVIAMHISIGFLMDLHFYKFQLLCLILIDWKWVYNYQQIITALTNMRLKEQGRLNLDVDVNHYLQSWKISPTG